MHESRNLHDRIHESILCSHVPRCLKLFLQHDDKVDLFQNTNACTAASEQMKNVQFVFAETRQSDMSGCSHYELSNTSSVCVCVCVCTGVCVQVCVCARAQDSV